MTFAFQDQPHADPDTAPQLPRHSVIADQRVLINPDGQLQVCVYTHPTSARGFVADGTLQGIPLGRPCMARVPDLALLTATQLMAREALLRLETPIVPGLPYTLVARPNMLGLFLKRGSGRSYVVMAAMQRRRSNGDEWLGFSENHHVDLRPRATSFEALLDVVDHLVDRNIWP